MVNPTRNTAVLPDRMEHATDEQKRRVRNRVVLRDDRLGVSRVATRELLDMLGLLDGR